MTDEQASTLIWLLVKIYRKMENVMAALQDLQNADQALKTEVATFLADIAQQLSAEDPAIEAVVTDINAEVAALQAADPVNQQPPAPTPAP